MWRLARFNRSIVRAWINIDDTVCLWKVGTLSEGQTWGQISDDGPYRPVTIISDEELKNLRRTARAAGIDQSRFRNFPR